MLGMWHKLSGKGKFVYFFVWTNLVFAFVEAYLGSMFCIVNMLVAMMCYFSLKLPQYQKPPEDSD
jgi:hypothetical protein